MTLTKEEIQKQIEAVRGLVKAYNELSWTNVKHSDTKIIIERIGALEEPLRELIATLKPHLEEGQQLDV